MNEGPKEDKFIMTYQIGKEFFKIREGYRLHDEINRYRQANPNGTVKEFVDYLVIQKIAVRLPGHPGFVMSLTGW